MSRGIDPTGRGEAGRSDASRKWTWRWKHRRRWRRRNGGPYVSLMSRTKHNPTGARHLIHFSRVVLVCYCLDPACAIIVCVSISRFCAICCCCTSDIFGCSPLAFCFFFRVLYVLPLSFSACSSCLFLYFVARADGCSEG